MPAPVRNLLYTDTPHGRALIVELDDANHTRFAFHGELLIEQQWSGNYGQWTLTLHAGTSGGTPWGRLVIDPPNPHWESWDRLGFSESR